MEFFPNRAGASFVLFSKLNPKSPCLMLGIKLASDEIDSDQPFNQRETRSSLN